MLINNSFEVPLPPGQAWKVLMDIPRIAPCMPGAELTDVVDENTYNGKVAVRLGPVALTFAGTVRFAEKDDAARKARVSAQGKDAKGRGGAGYRGEYCARRARSSHRGSNHACCCGSKAAGDFRLFSAVDAARIIVPPSFRKHQSVTWA